MGISGTVVLWIRRAGYLGIFGVLDWGSHVWSTSTFNEDLRSTYLLRRVLGCQVLVLSIGPRSTEFEGLLVRRTIYNVLNRVYEYIESFHPTQAFNIPIFI